MRTIFLAIANTCRFFTRDIWEKEPKQQRVDWDFDNSIYLCGTFR